MVISLVESSQKRTVNKLARDAGVEADFVAPDFEPALDEVAARPGVVGGVLISVGAATE